MTKNIEFEFDIGLTDTLPTPEIDPILLKMLSTTYKAQEVRSKGKHLKEKTLAKQARKYYNEKSYEGISSTPKMTVYRIDTSRTIMILSNKTQASLLAKHYSRDVRTIRSANALYFRLKRHQRLRLYGIRPSRVIPQHDKSISIQLTVIRKKQHSVGATYTINTLTELYTKVASGGVQLAYLGKDQKALRYVLDTLNIHYTDNELTTLVSMMDTSLNYNAQLSQHLELPSSVIFKTKRLSKKFKLLSRQIQRCQPAARTKTNIQLRERKKSE